MTEAPRLFGPSLSISTLRRRLSWLWGGNPFYLASAACILAGLYQILYPVYQQENPHLEKFYSLIALNGYELTLLGVTLLILAWRNVVDDAVALTVIISFFLVGGTMGLDVIAPGFTLSTFNLGLIAAFLAAVKLFSLDRFIVGRFAPLQLAGLAVLMACNLFVPALLSRSIGHDGLDPALIRLWLVGWWAALAGLGLLVLSPSVFPKGMAAADDAGKPFLRTSVMRWLVVGIVALGTLAHQWGLFWSFGLPMHVGDLFPGLLLLGLLAIEVLRAYGRGRAGLNLGVIAALLLVYSIIVTNGAYSFNPASRPIWGLISYPPLALLLTGVVIVATAWRRRIWHLRISGALYVLVALLTMGINPHAGGAFTFNQLPLIHTVYDFFTKHGPGWGLVILSFLILACGTVASLCKRPGRPARPEVGPGETPAVPVR